MMTTFPMSHPTHLKSEVRSYQVSEGALTFVEIVNIFNENHGKKVFYLQWFIKCKAQR